MSHTDHSSAIALALSLLLHGTALYVCRDIATSRDPAAAAPDNRHDSPIASRILVERVTEPPRELAPPQPGIEASHPEPPDPPERLPEIQPEPIIPPELAPPELPRMLPADGFGELSGSPDATALHSLSGDIPMQAAKAEQDQAPLSRAPASPPPPAVEAHPDTTPPSPPQVSHAAEPQLAATPRDGHAQAERPGPTAPIQADAALPGPFEPAPLPAKPDGEQLAAQAGQRAQNDATETVDAASGVTVAAAESHAAPQSDSDSDAFSVVGSAEFRLGKVTARFGRRVKTVRPRLSLAGQYDLLSANPRVVLKVRADETGRVREVTIARSSGSAIIDHACQLSMYEWWFEPPRDSNGQPRPAEMLWTISFVSR